MSTRTAARTQKERANMLPQHDNATDKENTTVNGHTPEAKLIRGKLNGKARKVYCTCRQLDDGSPMILCSECEEWYHFRCVDLKEADAEDIRLYVCPSCHQATGLYTVMKWEGPEAMEARQDQTRRVPSRSKTAKKGSNLKRPELEEEEESFSEDDGSEDDYVAEAHTTQGKRRARRLSMSSDSASSEVDTQSRKASKRLRRSSTASKDLTSKRDSESPGPARKRRQSTATQNIPPPKRHRAESTPSGDATRKYCFDKLEELFTQIFLRYPILTQDETTDSEDIKPSKKTEELEPEEKEFIERKAKQFVAELEQCIFDLYAEPDKTGKPHAGQKYKDRFRMLTFNLSKRDRIVVHRRIASSRLSPKELSTMSPADLANEEMKLSIKQAEQEALAQTILKKTVLPRAKMTHKGMQDIEDVTGMSSREREREREEEEEEDRIERERLARLRVQAERAQAQAANQGSVSPESPITPTWGGPPPVPMHLSGQSTAGPSASPVRPPANPLFVSTASEMVTPAAEGELNLADLINIDDEPNTEEISVSLSVPTPPPAPPVLSPSTRATPPDIAGPDDVVQGPASHVTGISPFASRSDLSNRPSFDLSSLWVPKDEITEPTPQPEEPVLLHVGDEVKSEQQQAIMDVDKLGEEAEDQDFDMFLRQDEEEKDISKQVKIPEPREVGLHALPQVWSGKISMPLDSTIPQEVALVARQVGGRSLGGDSPLWRTLFPADHLRIDGRVPVDKSAEYLTQTRLNPSKELIAVAFMPASDASSISFNTLMQYLIAKGRHGLVFPWGPRPRDHHPGRELYIIPLLSSENIPEYMELLDDLQLPKTRDHNLLVGIWVLNKGKLAPPPPTPVYVPQSTTPPAPGMPYQPAILPGTTPATPFPIPITASTPAQNIAASVNSEIASLTPEQIQLMLRTLQATTQQQQQQPQPPVPPVNIPQIPLQPWTNPAASYPGYTSPPPTGPRAYPAPGSSSPYPPYPDYPPERYDGYERRGGGRGPPPPDRGPRRPPPGPRGRADGRRGFDRPRDGGPKGRRRGRGGPATPPHDRGRWGGAPPPYDQQRWGPP